MSTPELTPDQQIRMAAVNAAVPAGQRWTGTEDHDYAGDLLEVAKKLEDYIRGVPVERQQINIFSSPGEIWVENGEFPDLTGCEISIDGNIEKHTHLPQQHRDGKPPWCRACGRDKYGQKPVSILKKD